MRALPITTMRVESGALWFAAEHQRRLVSAARALGLAAPDLSCFETAARAAAGAATSACIHIRMEETGVLHFEGEPLRAPGPPLRLQPVEASPLRERVRFKTSDRADYEAAHRRALPLDDALLVLPTGEILETTIANLFVLRAGVLLTPEDALPLLPGIARGRILAASGACGLEVREARPRLADLAGCEAAFLSNALFPVQPVAEVAGWASFPALSGVVRDLWDAVVGGASRPV